MSKLNFRKTRKRFRKRIVRASGCLLTAAFLLSMPVGAVNLGHPAIPEKVKKANRSRKKIKLALAAVYQILVIMFAYSLPSPFNNSK